MTKKQIVENNKLLAEFMGLKEGWWISGEKKQKQYCDIGGFLDSKTYYASDLIFHSDWNWLIAACKKWDNLKIFYGTKNEDMYVDLSDFLDESVTLYRIDTVFLQLIYNIKWHNGQIKWTTNKQITS